MRDRDSFQIGTPGVGSLVAVGWQEAELYTLTLMLIELTRAETINSQVNLFNTHIQGTKSISPKSFLQLDICAMDANTVV